MWFVFVKFILFEVNVFIFDELINYLDIESKEVLEVVLIDFEGMIFFVFYDCYFINWIVFKIVELVFEKVIVFLGDYDYY